MHRQAAQSNIIIVNHHLFFADLAVRNQAFGALIPEYSAVIFDEAHEIEDIAGQYFGISVSNVQFQHLVRDIADISRQKMFSTPELDRSLVQLGERVEVFFQLFPREGRHAFNSHEAFPRRTQRHLSRAAVHARSGLWAPRDGAGQCGGDAAACPAG